MKRNVLLAIALVTVGLAVVPQVQAQEGEGWPPADQLKEYGLEGMTLPEGMTQIEWTVNERSMRLTITFRATDATITALKKWYSTNGWTVTKNQSAEQRTLTTYSKEVDYYPYRSTLSFAHDRQRGYIEATPDI